MKNLAFKVGVAALAAASAAAVPAQDLEALNARVNEQVRRLNELRRALDEEEARLVELRRAVGVQMLADRQAARAVPDAPSPPPEGGTRLPLPRTAPIFEEPSVLTRAGGWVLEPSLQYANSSNNRVSLLGYTIVPALVIGLVDVREVKRNTATAALTLRHGVTRRFEVEARVPYLYRSDTIKAREIGVGSALDKVVGASGRGLGDVELAGRYQLTDGQGRWPVTIASLRYKARNGTDPFEVVTDCQQRCAGEGTTGTGQPLSLPTGSGFRSLQAGLTWLVPSDPAVLFGSFSYLHNFARDQVQRRVLDGQYELLGRLAPGPVLGFNVGIGLALNDRGSFSVGYDHASVATTKQNGVTVPGSVRAQVGTLVFGYSFRLDERRTLNFSIGAGLTPDAADVTLGVRMPLSM